jgi:UDP-N-acetyl-2-amino-2-deoxyglucuronate dehydrogenase
MADYGFAIVGCGMIADFHAAAIKELKHGRLVVAASRSEKNARRVAEAQGCDWTTDYEAVYRRPDVQVVNVCTPSGAHSEIAVAAARAGKHVVIEKPLEVTLERCDQIIEACRQSGVTCAVIFPSRWSEVIRKVKAAVDAGRFGRLTLGDAHIKWWRTQEYYDSGQWRGTWALDGGGALMNQGSHTIDVLQWFMGPVRRIQAFARTLAHQRIEVEDVAVAALEFENGALGVIEGTTAAFPGLSRWIGVHGDRGSAVIEDSNLVRWGFAEPQPEDDAVAQEFAPTLKGATVTWMPNGFTVREVKTAGYGAADPRAISHVGHRKQLEDFLDAVEQRRAPLVDGPEGRKTVEIILGIYQSARTGRAVTLPL